MNATPTLPETSAARPIRASADRILALRSEDPDRERDLAAVGDLYGAVYLRYFARYFEDGGPTRELEPTVADRIGRFAIAYSAIPRDRDVEISDLERLATAALGFELAVRTAERSENAA